MVVRQRWGSAVFLAVLLHIFVICAAGIFLPDDEGDPYGTEELTWLDVYAEHEDSSERAAEPAKEVPEIVTEEPEVAEEIVPEPSPPAPPPQAARAQPEGEKKPTADAKKPPQKRDYPEMRKPNKPAVLQLETKRGLAEKETSYKGRVQFFADISREGLVTDIQAWQFEPEIADEKERRLLEERLAKRIKESWRYAPSLTPEGVPTTQTKREELDIPEKQQPKDVR